MKAIKIIARQTLASYRKPSSFQIKESYPLPPYSTVIGMVHFACGFDKYIDMDVSIQGKYYSKVNELYTRYEFKPGLYLADRHKLKTETNDCKATGITAGPANVELLTNVELVIHIKPKEESMTETIYNGLLNPQEYLSLGRREDLIVIEKVELVNVREKILEENLKLKYDVYAPINALERRDADKNATVYKLNKKYTINPKTKIRFWEEQIYVKHLSENSIINADSKINIDDDEDIVFLD